MNYEKYAIADIHLHLDGSLSPKAVIDVAKKENIKLPTYDEKELIDYLQAPENCPSLNELLKRFDLPNLVLLCFLKNLPSLFMALLKLNG